MKIILFTKVVFIIFLFLSCKDNEPTAPELQPTSGIITAKDGGTITTDDGFSVEFPPGALLEDTEIILTPFKGTDMHEWCVSSVHLEPDGLNLEKPAKLNFPLPSGWPEDHHPLMFVSFESDPADYFNTGVCADIVNSENGLFAQTEILHFSKYGVIGNCHKGTLAFLLDNFEQRGCDNNTTWQKVKDKFKNANTDIVSNPQTGHNTLQAFLGTYFQDIGGLDKNELTSNKWNAITDYIKNQNKRVVVLFTKDKWGTKNSEGFYNFIPHSATIEIKDGKLKLRNSISAKPAVLNALKENVIWYPKDNEELNADSLDKFRNMRSFEAVENHLKDKPELFSNLPDISKRKQPWTAVRFYVANQPDDVNPCITPTLDFNYNKFSLDIIVWGEYSYSYQGNNFLPAALTWSGDIQFIEAENKCIGSWDEDRGEEHHKGNIEIIFNPLNKAVTSFSAKNEWTNSYGEVYKDSVKSKTKDLAINYDGDFRDYKLFGQDVCDYIDKLEYTGGNEYTGFTLVNLTCQGDSYLNIYFYSQN